MAAGLDAGAVLRALANHPDAFPAVRADASDFARKAMVKQLKDKAITAELLRRICEASCEEVLAAVLDDWAPTDVRALVKKADPLSAYARTGSDEAGARRHVIELATGRAEMAEATQKAEKPAKVKKTPALPQSKIGSVLQSKVHSGAKRPTRAKKVS